MRGSLRHEITHDVVGIVGVTDAVRGSQQHLQQQVRHRGAKGDQPFHGHSLRNRSDIEGSAAPALHGKELRQQARVVRLCRACGTASRAATGAHRGRRVGEQHSFLLEHPLRELPRPELVEPLARPGGARRRKPRRTRLEECATAPPCPSPRVAVDDHLADEAQQPWRDRACAGNGTAPASRRRTGVCSARPKRGCMITWSRKRRLVTTPRTRNSQSARCIRAIVSSALGAHAVTLTSSESYRRGDERPYTRFPSSRCRTRPDSGRP